MDRAIKSRRRLLLVCATSLLAWVITQHFRFSFTNSCGSRFFWKVECPKALPRGQYVAVVPPDNPYVPDYVRSLMKRAWCFPGETVIRHGLHFWCRAGKMRLDMGQTKLRTRDGKPIKPFLYDQGESANYTLGDHEYFLLGRPIPGSYDSRYFGPVGPERIEGCFEPLF